MSGKLKRKYRLYSEFVVTGGIINKIDRDFKAVKDDKWGSLLNRNNERFDKPTKLKWPVDIELSRSNDS